MPRSILPKSFGIFPGRTTNLLPKRFSRGRSPSSAAGVKVTISPFSQAHGREIVFSGFLFTRYPQTVSQPERIVLYLKSGAPQRDSPFSTGFSTPGKLARLDASFQLLEDHTQ